MNRNLIFLVLFLITWGCEPKKEIVIKNKNIRELFVNTDFRSPVSPKNTLHITNQDSLNRVVEYLNDCVKKSMIFSPTHAILIFYKDNDSLIILCNKKAIKLNGKTYKMKKNIEEIIR